MPSTSYRSRKGPYLTEPPEPEPNRKGLNAGNFISSFGGVGVVANSRKADAQKFAMSGGKRPIADPQLLLCMHVNLVNRSYLNVGY
jgi:hypothetical protein